MPSLTGLPLNLSTYNGTTDASATFLSYRTALNGISNSNATKTNDWAALVSGSIVNLQTQRPVTSMVGTLISPNYYEATASLITTYSSDLMINLRLYHGTVSSASANTGTITLNINGLGTKTLQKISFTTGSPINFLGGEIAVGTEQLFRYNGSIFVWVSADSSDQIRTSGSQNELLMVSSASSITNTGFTFSQTPTANQFPVINSGSNLILPKNIYLSGSSTVIGNSYTGGSSTVIGNSYTGGNSTIVGSEYTSGSLTVSGSIIALGLNNYFLHNVGIGIASPGDLLTVSNPTTHATIRIDSATAAKASDLQLYNAGGRKWSISSRGTLDSPNDRLGFMAGAGYTEVFTITSDGDVYSQKGTWTPAFTNFTLGAPSTVTYAGTYTKIGKIVWVTIKITPTGGTTTASTANSTYCNNLPFSTASENVCYAVDLNVNSLGNGRIITFSTYLSPPTWSARTSAITISGWYETA